MLNRAGGGIIYFERICRIMSQKDVFLILVVLFRTKTTFNLRLKLILVVSSRTEMTFQSFWS